MRDFYRRVYYTFLKLRAYTQNGKLHGLYGNNYIHPILDLTEIKEDEYKELCRDNVIFFIARYRMR